MFIKARKLAFEDKNYTAAIALTKKALIKSPDYTDIEIFLGRLYTFSDKIDSARVMFKEAVRKNPTYEDTYLAYGNLENWNDQSVKALEIVDTGLSYHPKSESLLILKAKILKSLNRYPEANSVLTQTLKLYPKSTEARSLSQSVAYLSSNNTISLGYSQTNFDKQFDDPWRFGNISYGRQTKLGSIITRYNYANRFKTNGSQVEVDLYPKISQLFYAYVSGGYSNTVGVFPKYRSGFSLYSNLPASFEAEVGLRTLSFDKTTVIYTASVGKYYKNYWFNLRTYLTPSNNSVSQSFSLNVRYYTGGQDDYLSFGIGTGISPDNRSNNVQFDARNPYKLKSNNASFGYYKSIKRTTLISLSFSYENQEYLPQTRGNQFAIGLGLSKRF
ncbi:MAG: YaiO family outer membrane beta-barrel protein [Bacteroidetes bacterium]|nr:YaiO family outer membrane beta-barrel protein [Bacteroidota bacterium]MBU1372716.1 YaiO family outer membrane beta-barrel protein [Bacteroidota bacterium]MBU1484912.1 YaiO family outer membrane beta-barrel protein [Bacteroidota bacterium]MBU1761247.1 YaiO family outer membrane beta-barrel protein [Bacteroidota bacterium]MBU2266488.1 YaiO family outer membrane beta-barrel protein [Bacteroidota bacterium]